MRPTPFLLAAVTIIPALTLAATAEGQAQTRPAHPARPASAGAPKSIGKFEDWQAATHQEAGQLVCYAFTRASASAPALPGRGDVVLTVTQRQGGRDAVAMTTGFAYAGGAEVQMQVEGASLPFYTASRSAFARDGKAVVGAFDKGRQAVAKSPGPRGIAVSDTFSLRGFGAAYSAISKACPR